MNPISSHKASTLSGTTRIPGDKSISHRALMFGALAQGTTRIEGLLEGEDVLSTAAAMRAMGAHITKENNQWVVEGVGTQGLKQPNTPLDMGNSGTSARLLSGIIAGHAITATLTGDASLSKRPMKRVIDPLSQMGAQFESTGGKMPITIHGGNLCCINYEMPVASAQVKSAVILAGLQATGTTTVREPKPSRDHTERMLTAFGVTCTSQNNVISIKGGQHLTAPTQTIHVPGDPSSAAFPVVAALIVEGSDITIENVGLNPTRTGLFQTLIDMGARIEFLNKRKIGGEDVADLRVRHSNLTGITVPIDRVPSMVDEFPILFVAASVAKGETYCDGLEELRVKESDRLHIMAEHLGACGIKVQEGENSLRIFGNNTPPKGGTTIATHLDHRIAMSFLVLGMASNNPITIDDGTAIATSFPGFTDMMNNLGGRIT